MPNPLIDFKGDIVELCEGNPGCLTLMCQLLVANSDCAKELIDGIRILDLRGSRLWLAYKDVLKCDLDALVVRLLDQDKNLIEDVKKCRQ